MLRPDPPIFSPQNPKNAHWHAMRNGDVNESVESAWNRTNEYIDGELGKCDALGLGRALHAEQDKWAAGHRGYQPISSKWTLREWANHWWMDTTGDYEDVAVSASVQLIKRFKEICPCACGR